MKVSKGIKAIKVLCNTFAIEVEVVDSDTIKYKYSNDEEWIECEIQYLLREDDVNGDVVPGFVTEDDEKYYLDEFIVA
jgi:hypothetical protein